MTSRAPCAGLVRALLFAAGLSLAAGCTLLDDYLPGSPFGTKQPEAAVTLQGEMHASPITDPSEGCSPGGTVFWGAVRNTGDVDVTDVSIVIEVFGGSGALLGSFENSVFNGEVVDDPEGGIDQFGTDLVVDQNGTFTVCTTVPFGSAARTEHRTEFLVLDTSGG